MKQIISRNQFKEAIKVLELRVINLVPSYQREISNYLDFRTVMLYINQYSDNEIINFFCGTYTYRRTLNIYLKGNAAQLIDCISWEDVECEYEDMSIADIDILWNKHRKRDITVENLIYQEIEHYQLMDKIILTDE